jgi:membrane-associated protease RseP (regulator of RpoE activity)
MKLLTLSLFPDLGSTEDVILHPVAFAGWIGLLVTMLNLLPIGQLDGGHIAYALLGEKFNILAKYVLLLLIPMSYFSLNWLVWGLLILLLMRTTKHPPIYNIEDPLTNREKWIGATSLAIFILCFIPAPFPS